MKVSFYNMETSIAMDLGLAVFTAALGEQFPNCARHILFLVSSPSVLPVVA